MSSSNLYPPQAFTREMLSQAYMWLQAQPESVRELARNPESLIALYLKTQRSQLYNQKKMESQSTNPYADAPVSAQNFMTDLKSLAEGLKQFEDPAPANQGLSQGMSQSTSPAPQLPPLPPPVFQQERVQAPQGFAAQLRSEIPGSKVQTPQLNSSSQYMIREVKEKLNLSSDLEAINMLVAIAYKNLKSLID